MGVTGAGEDAIVLRRVPIAADVEVIEVLFLIPLNRRSSAAPSRDVGQGICIEIVEADRVLLGGRDDVAREWRPVDTFLMT